MATSVPAQKIWRGRNVCWTLHDYTEGDVAKLRAYAQATSYLVFGYEKCPDTGRPHLQGYLEWDNPHSILKFKKTISDKLHCEERRGTALQASNYCKYDDYPENKVPNKYEEFGQLSNQGNRTDWKQAVEQVRQGIPIDEIIDAQPQLVPAMRSLELLKVRQLKPLNRPVEVIVIWGDAGTGKSRWAYDNYPDLYSKPPTKWWDGYTGQKTVLLDDFYGYIPYSELLNVLDRYPFHAEVKGGYVWAQWTTVIITSNKPPKKWYHLGLTPALERRLHKTYAISIKDAIRNTPENWKGSTEELPVNGGNDCSQVSP